MVSNVQKWVPHKKQAEFLAIPFSIKEAFYGGGAGSAKTETLLNYGIIHRLHENPRFKQVVLRRTFPELRNEIVPRSKLIYTKFDAKFNSQQMTWTFPSGAMIFLGHCENENDVHQYDSMEITLFTPDELTSLTEWMYLYIAFERGRSAKNSGLPAIIRAAGMPGNIGHSWVKKRFIDPYPEGGKVILGRGGNKRVFIHATLADNPHIDPGYAQSLEGLPEAEKQAKKYGKWDAYLGSVFEEFRDRHYPDEPENAVHVIEPFKIEVWWPKLVAIDWGFNPPAMTYALFAAISPEKKVIAYRERHWQKTKIEDWCAELVPYLDEDNPRVIKLCGSARQDRGQEHTIHQQVESALGRPVSLTVNSSGSRVAGKMLLHEYLRWKPKYIAVKPKLPFNQEHAQWILRNRGMKEYNSYLHSFVDELPEGNLPKLLMFTECQLLAAAIKLASYDKTNPQDVAEFPGDDPYDTIRYIIDEADRFFNDVTGEAAKLEAREQLVKELETTQDMTAFYRNARTLEVMDKGTKAVRRYHRAH